MNEVIELLKQIEEHTKPDNSAVWVAAISSASALIGAGIGAALLYRGTARQTEATSEIEEKKLKVNIVTTERLRWLQELRVKSSEFYANHDMNYSLLKRAVAEDDLPKYQEKSDEVSMTIMIQSHQIILLLNPNKKHQKEMREACSDSLAFFLQCTNQMNNGNYNFDDKSYSDIKTKYFNALTEIGIETWRKIKLLD